MKHKAYTKAEHSQDINAKHTLFKKDNTKHELMKPMVYFWVRYEHSTEIKKKFNDLQSDCTIANSCFNTPLTSQPAPPNTHMALNDRLNFKKHISVFPSTVSPYTSRPKLKASPPRLGVGWGGVWGVILFYTAVRKEVHMHGCNERCSPACHAQVYTPTQGNEQKQRELIHWPLTNDR